MKTDLISGSIHLFCAGVLLPIIFLDSPFKLFIFNSLFFGFNLFLGIHRIHKVYIL